MLQNSNIPFLPGYKHQLTPSVYGKSGGLVVYYRDCYKIDVIINECILPDSLSEILTMHFLDKSTFLTLIYRHPTGNVNSFIDTLDNILSSGNMQVTNKNYIFCGDINIDALSVSKRTTTYLSLLKSFNYNFHIEQPTRITGSSTTCIDHVFTKLQITNSIDLKLRDFHFLDHKSISFNLFGSTNKNQNCAAYKRFYTSQNIKDFLECLDRINWNAYLSDSHDLDSNIHSFLKIIIETHNNNIPEKRIVKQTNQSDWLTNKLKNMIKHKNYLLRKANKTKNIKNITRFKEFNNLLRNHIKKSKQLYYQNIINNKDAKQKWKILNKISNKRRTEQTEYKISESDYAHYLKEIFSLKNKNINLNLPSGCCEHSIFLRETNQDEILSCFNSFKPKHTKQNLDLPMFIWRLVGSKVMHPTVYLVNRMIKEAYFPQIFKMADVIPVFKKGDKAIVKNYRPITCLHNFSKIFERILLNRIVDFVGTYKILPNTQFGFRHGHSTRDAVFSLLLNVETNKNNGKKTCCCFLDLSKAFDVVNHAKLLKIFDNLGFRGQCGTLIHSFLTNRSFRVKMGNKTTDYMPIKRGVPQGSLLSPIFYSLYTHNFISVHSDIIQYADDSTIMIEYSNITELQDSLNKVSDKLRRYLEDHDLDINVNKTEIMLFSDSQGVCLNFLHQSIETVNETKFLGIILTPDCSFNIHVDKIIIPNIRRHFSLFYNLSNVLNRHNKKTIFQALIFPYILYCIPFLQSCGQLTIKRLSKNYNKCLRLLFRLPPLFPSNKLTQYTAIDSCQSIIYQHTLIYAYLIYNKLSPYFIHNTFIRTNRANFILKHQRTKFSLHNNIAICWNNLANSLRLIQTKTKFKHAIKHLQSNN